MLIKQRKTPGITGGPAYDFSKLCDDCDTLKILKYLENV